MSRSTVLGIACALTLLALPNGVCPPTEAAAARADSAQGLGAGQTPPPFHATDLDGRPQSLEQYAGSVVVLHFWATWCPYCRAEIPKLVRIHHELADRGVTILAVSVDEDVGKVRAFTASESLPYTVIADAQKHFALAQDYNILGIPATYVIDRDGRIAVRLTGPSDIFGIVQRVAATGAKDS